MITVDAWLNKHHPDTNLTMQVHDELVLEVPKDKLEVVQAGVCKLMEDAADLDVPLVVDAGNGPDWDSAH